MLISKVEFFQFPEACPQIKASVADHLLSCLIWRHEDIASGWPTISGFECFYRTWFPNIFRSLSRRTHFLLPETGLFQRKMKFSIFFFNELIQNPTKLKQIAVFQNFRKKWCFFSVFLNSWKIFMKMSWEMCCEIKIILYEHCVLFGYQAFALFWFFWNQKMNSISKNDMIGFSKS